MNKKYVVITGASSGIGRATAKKFASLDRNVILVARREAELLVLKEEILKEYPNVDVVIVVQDLGSISQLEDFYHSLDSYPIDIWMNNAGFGRHKPVADMEISEIKSMIQLNVESLTILSMLFVKDYKDDPDAQLINISSLAGYFTLPNVSVYSGTKFFVSAFTEGLAHELRLNGNKMQAKVMAPGATATEFAKIADDKEQDVDYEKRYHKQYNTSEELANYIVTLVNSDRSVGMVNEQMQLELFNDKTPHF